MGEPPTKKSRFCVRGDQDPDIYDLEKYAPTVTTQNLQVVLQLASSLQLSGSCGDLKAAFTQSNPLKRPKSALFIRQPKHGLPGLDPEQIIEIVAGVYGLLDGPIHWRQTLKEYVTGTLQYKQSRLDPCIFKLHLPDGSLEGIIIIEIDDLLNFGKGVHAAKLAELQRRFKFGKFKELQAMPEGTTFNGRRIRQLPDYTIAVDMTKYVIERLAPMTLEKGRRSQPEAPASEDEKSRFRGAVGSLAWAAKEGRPDAAAGASILASKAANLQVKDLLELNKVIQKVKETPELTLRYFPIPPSELCWGVITDASFTNHGDGGSQGALGILAFHRDLLSGHRATCSLIWWKSGKLRRKVNSTLAAETQSLNKGLGDLLWSKAIWRDLLDVRFSIEEFRADVQKEAEMVLQKADADAQLKESLTIVDAKSLYDNLRKDGSLAQDKYTALDVAIARERIDGLQAHVRWVEHHAMIVDCLTKINGNPAALFKLLTEGSYAVVAEEESLEFRSSERATGSVRRR